MATSASNACGDPSYESRSDGSSVRVLRCVLGEILDDDSFPIPTEGNQCHLFKAY